MAETEVSCFQEGFQWPPAHVHHEPCLQCKDQELKYPRYRYQYQYRRDFRPSPSPAATADAEPIFHHLKLIKSTTSGLQKSSSRRYQVMPTTAPTSNSNGFGGPGMQAVFLDSPQKSCGTGVFLPRISTGTGTTHSYTSIKPACPPVLLPSRVVQALNLNVHDIDFQTKLRTLTDKSKPLTEPMKQNKNMYKNKKKRDALSAQNYSPEIFLPKEWTY